MHHEKWIALGLSAVLAISMLTGCQTADSNSNAGDVTSTEVVQDLLSLYDSSNAANPRTPATVDLSGAVEITLSGTSVGINGTGASEANGVITISDAGTYVFRGSLTDGRILVNDKGQDVTLVLDGADIICSYGSPIYIYKAASTTIHLMEGTENTLTDGESYTFADEYSSQEENEPNACLYSKSDLILQGAGSLTINANYDNALTGKDTLEIYDLTLTVNAVGNGINGKDSNTIDSATITVASGGDAIRSTNDTDATLGWIRISNSTLKLTAAEDGIQAETAVVMSSGTYSITTGGGHEGEIADDASAKGIKAGTAVNLVSGIYTLDCCDDGVHSNGDVTVSGGVYTVSSGDDAFHADETLTVDGGEIGILASYEGLEGTVVNITGGKVELVSSDDGVNAGGGADGSGFMGRGGGNTFGSTDSSYLVNITGGDLVVHAGGDGLDSNGNITMTGGTVIVTSTGHGDGALDYDRSFTLSGGTLLAIGAGSMPQAPSEATQNTVFLNLDTTLPAGTYLALLGDGQDFVSELPIDAANVVFSSPDLKDGATYTVSYGGAYSGDSTDGVCSGGSYSGGTQLTELTLTETITRYGNASMGGGNRGQMPSGEKPERPPDGNFDFDKKNSEQSGNDFPREYGGKDGLTGGSGKTGTADDSVSG